MKYSLRFPFIAKDAAPIASSVEQEFVDEMNKLRTGQPALRLDPVLSTIANTRAETSALLGLPLTHRDSTGNLYISALIAPPYKWAGENLYYTTRQNSNLAVETVAAWKSSPTHLDNMLFAEYSRVGVGIYVDGDQAHWVAAVFLAP